MINIMGSTKMFTLTERDVEIVLVAIEERIDTLRRREYLAQADSNADLAERLRDDIRELRTTAERLEAQL